MNGGDALNVKTLRRIVALLVSFAALAERAANRSFPVRWLVLTVLRCAEGIARDYVAETTGVDWAACFEHDVEPANGPDDAALLAWRFRALAAMLGMLLPADHTDGWTAGRDAAPGCLAPRADRHPAAPGGWPRRAPDTS